LRAATVMTRTSRSSAGSVVASKIALSLRKPFSSSGDVARRATADGTRPNFFAVAAIAGRAAGGADSGV